MVGKRTLLLCLLGLLLILSSVVLAACGGSTTTAAPATTATTAAPATTATTAAPTTTTAAASTDPIIIGFAIAQSGFGAPFDGPSAAMSEMAIADINAKGGLLGRQLKSVYADGKTDPAQTAIAGLEVLSKGAELMICTANFEVGGPAARAANDAGVVAFAPGCADLKLGVQGIGPLAYVMSSSIGSAASVMAEFSYTTKGWKNAYILEDTMIAVFKEMSDAYTEVFEKLSGKIVGRDTFANADTSIAAQISKIKAISPAPDVIVLATMPPGGAAAVRQIRAAGITAPLLGGDVFDGEVWYEAVPDVTDFYYVTNVSQFGDDPDPAVNDIIKRYREKNPGPISSGIAILGYSAIEAMAIAVEKAGTTDGKAVAAVLDTFKDRPLLVGPTTFTPEWHISFDRPLRVMELVDGKHKFVAVVKATIHPEKKL